MVSGAFAKGTGDSARATGNFAEATGDSILSTSASHQGQEQGDAKMHTNPNVKLRCIAHGGVSHIEGIVLHEF